MALFSQIERSDPSPARYGEDSFSFLDRVDQKFWQRIRAELEKWFAEYPANEAGDLRSRFQKNDPAQHFALVLGGSYISIASSPNWGFALTSIQSWRMYRVGPTSALRIPTAPS